MAKSRSFSGGQNILFRALGGMAPCPLDPPVPGPGASETKPEATRFQAPGPRDHARGLETKIRGPTETKFGGP